MNTYNVCHGCTQVLHVLHLTQAALQPGQHIIGNKLTTEHFQSVYDALFDENGFVADFGCDPYTEPLQAWRTCNFERKFP